VTHGSPTGDGEEKVSVEELERIILSPYPTIMEAENDPKCKKT